MAQIRANVQAPPARPPVYGLIAAAPAIEDPDLRWAGGWSFQPEGCGLGGKVAVVCEGDTTQAGLGGPAVVEGEPIWIFGADRCTTMQRSRDNEGRARRQLAAVESYQLADELWSGTVTAAATPDLANRWLAGDAADSDTLTTAGVTPVAGLGCVTQGLAEYLKGQPGMVHVTPQLLQHLVADNIVTRQGNLWVTAMGHIVVADAGYSGDGPGGVAAGATQWMYGTAMVRVRRGPVELTDTIDHTVNTRLVVAGRLAGVQWDSECAHVAAEIAIPLCAVGGAA